MEKTHIIITIGRQFGSGGRKVAQEIGRKLDIPVYDKSILSEAAKGCGYSSDIFNRRDEKKHLFGLSRMFSSLYSNETNYMEDNALFQIQSDAIKELAEKGSCIFVGRCADYILREKENMLSVFLTSPLQTRVMRVMERMGVDNATARKIISRKEKDRRAHYEGYTLGKWGDAGTYDLCIDTSVLGIEGTADLIIDAARQRGMLSGSSSPENNAASDRVQKAVELFMQGYGCCQSVVAAFADLYGMTPETALRIGSGFGAGIGKLRMICGAASALVILAGLEKGTTRGDDRDGKGECYKLVQELLEEFRKQNGSYICAELLGLEKAPAKGDFIPQERNSEYYRSRPCAAKVECAARIWAAHMDGIKFLLQEKCTEK